MKNDRSKQNTRPIVEVQLSNNDTPLAVFTHATLRPVLKQLHATICAVIDNDKNLNSSNLSIDKEAQNTAYLKSFLQKNTETRNLVIGAIIGNFSAEELTFYLQHQKEINRRIIEMVITRYLSQITEGYATK